MKRYLASFSSALAIIGLVHTGAASAAPEQSAEAATIAHSWRIDHDNLLREFSHGLAVDLGASS
jgi:hypothetical protein